jgi:hypothetical protein
VLKFDGGTWQATRADTGAAVPMTGTGTAADPLVLNGVELVMSGTPAQNDRFLLQPTAGVAGTLAVAITDTSRIAAAAPVKAAAGLTNTGTGKISGVAVTDSSNANLRNPAAIVFTSATEYNRRRHRPVHLHRRPDHQRQRLELRAGRRAQGRRQLQHEPHPGRLQRQHPTPCCWPRSRTPRPSMPARSPSTVRWAG